MSKAASRSWGHARSVLRRHRARLLKRKGVVAAYVGLKDVDGELKSGPSIRIQVIEKLPLDELSPRQRLPASIEGVRVDVVEGQGFAGGGCLSSSSPRRASHSTLVGGIGISAFRAGLGTLGMLVRDAAGTVFGLTAAHVASTNAGPSVTQPSGGTLIGCVQRHQWTSAMDAALITLNSARQHSFSVLGVASFDPTPRSVAASELPLAVEVVGACTGRVKGLISSVDFEGDVSYPKHHRSVRFAGQYVVEPLPGQSLARQGDSGGLVLRGGRPVGLLFAVDPSAGGRALATPIARVLGEFGVTG